MKYKGEKTFKYPWYLKVFDYCTTITPYQRFLREHSHYCEWVQGRNEFMFRNKR